MQKNTTNPARAAIYVDSSNVDGVLGVILGRRPNPHDRPRWDRVKAHLMSSGKPHFVIARHSFSDKVYPLYRALRTLGWQIDVVSDAVSHNPDPVDVFILRECGSILDARRAASCKG